MVFLCFEVSFWSCFGLKLDLKAYPKNNRSGATITVRVRQ